MLGLSSRRKRRNQMAKGTKVLKTGVPKLKDLKEFEQIIIIEGSNLDQFRNVLSNAVPEIGRKLAKSNYNYGKNELMGSLAVATSIDLALEEQVDVNNYHKQRAVYANYNGFDNLNWVETDKCGNTTSNDFQDLYESPKYEIIVRVVAPLKDKAELARRGVK
jgi:hypothetical protein